MGSAYFDSHSLWQQSEKPLCTSTIAENIKTDTCIVGAGIAGLTTAYMLCKAGQQVVVLERERLGLGETGLTSAHLSNSLDEHFQKLIRLHGREGARLAAESHSSAIDAIERICHEEGIHCDFKRVDGYLFLGRGHDPDYLRHELEAVHASGLPDVKWLESVSVGFFESGPCLHYPRQAQFHPLKYLAGLAEAIGKMGGRILTHSEVTEIAGGKNAFVKTSQGFKVECSNIVVATNTPINNRVAIHTKNAAYRSYLIGIPAPIESVQDVLLWDTADPYHYIRFAKDPATGEDLLLVGGEDHRTGQDTHAEAHFENLHQWAKTHFGLLSRVVTRWSGQVMEPIDGIAYIGRNPGDEHNVYVVTGDSGHGLTHATIAGALLCDLIHERDNPWAKLYDPSRLHAKSLGAYISGAAQSAIPYMDWLKNGDVRSPHEIEAGEGAVIRDGLNKIAVYKDELSRLHCVSAVCPHLGGIVRWNSAEKTWDCPCHGSRFDRFGQILNGPAVSELASVNDPTSPAEDWDLGKLSPT